MKLKTNDKVLIITGKDRGKTGKIIRVISKSGKIVVEGRNIRTKHIKKSEGRAGEKIKFEAPINASNVMILDPTMDKPTRIGYRILENGKKERISKLSGTSLDSIIADNAPQKRTTKKSENAKNGKAEKESKPTKSKKTVVKA